MTNHAASSPGNLTLTEEYTLVTATAAGSKGRHYDLYLFKTWEDIVITTTSYEGDKMTYKKNSVDGRVARGNKTKDIIQDIVLRSDQPLVSGEIQAIAASRGLLLARTYVLQVLNELVKEKRLSSRQETPDERSIRTSDNRGIAFTALYYWAPGGKVPFRTKKSTVSYVAARRRTTRKTAPKAKRQTAAPTLTTTNLMDRIDSMTNELALLKRVAELEAQLSAIKKVIK